MDGTGDSTEVKPLARSIYRVKVAALSIVFLGCWLALIFQVTRHWEYIFVLAGASAVSVNFVRCERCHSSLYYRAGGTRVFFYGPKSASFLWSKQCPACGLERV
jgi:hypothetical protein